MPDDDKQDPLLEPGQPLWYLTRLEARLDERQEAIKRFDDYYSGKHPLAYATERFEEVFGGLFKEFADNWCDLVCDAVRERIKIQGFRIGENRGSDEDAHRIWQANHLDAESQLAHSELLKSSECSVLIWNDPADEDTPSITIEPPTEMIVGFAAGSRRRRVAALKRWIDDDEIEQATLYLPDGIYKFTAATDDSSGMGGTRWAQREVDGETWPLKNPTGVVPVVTLFNKPRLRMRDGFFGESEIAKVLPIQDGVNKTLMDMFVASEYGSYRQRYVTGLELPRDPKTGERMKAFEAALERLWMTKSKDAKFGEFEATDLGNFVKSIEMLVQHIASQTRTPPHYFYLRGEFPSGESIKSAETGLVAKANEKMLFLGDDWEEVQRVSFKVLDDPRGDEMQSETIWGDPEYRSEAEHIDALLKQKALGIPEEILWEKAGYSQTEIARIKQIRAEAGFVEGVFNQDPVANAS